MANDSDFALPELPPKPKREFTLPDFVSDGPIPPAAPIQSGRFKKDPLSGNSVIIVPDETATAVEYAQNQEPDEAAQAIMRARFEARERFGMPNINPTDGKGIAVRGDRPHKLPDAVKVMNYVTRAASFIDAASKAGKISSSQLSEVESYINEGVGLCAGTFTQYTPGQYDNDALDHIRSVRDQYETMLIDLGGKKGAISANATMSKVFNTDLKTLAERFYEHTLSYCAGGELPNGVHAQFEIAKALNAAYEGCLMSIDAPLPPLETENEPKLDIAPKKEAPKKAPPKAALKDEGARLSVADDPEAQTSEKRYAATQEERRRETESGRKDNYIIARTQRVQLRQEMTSNRKNMYGAIKATASDAEKTEAAEALLRVVKQSIALMQLTGDKKPLLDLEAIKDKSKAYSNELMLFEEKLPQAVMSLVKPVQKSGWFIAKMGNGPNAFPAQTRTVLRNLIALQPQEGVELQRG